MNNHCKELISLLQKKSLKISSVESFTGGLFIENLISISGASKVVTGGIVSYHNIIKENVVGIPNELILRHGVISKEVASLMATNGNTILQSDICVSFTGNAGPDVLESKQVGKVYIAIAISNQIFEFCNVFSGERDDIRQQSVDFAIMNLLKILTNNFTNVSHNTNGGFYE